MSNRWETWLAIAAFALLLLGGRGCDVPGIGPLAGPRHVLIVREAQAQTPELSMTITAIRNGETAKYFADKKHVVDVVDDDAIDANGRPVPLVAKFGPYKPEGELLILSPPDSLLYRGPIGDAANVLAKVKEYGG